jgi:uncharacterized protein YggE
MKKRLIGFVAFALLVGALASACSARGTSGNGNSNPVLNLNSAAAVQQSGIWTNGEGEVKAIPDTAVLVLGVESQAATVSNAQQQAQQSMDTVMKALKSNGVADKDIQTQRFSITPVLQYSDKGNNPQIVAYTVSNSLTVKIRQVNNTGPVIDAVAQAGGNLTRISNVNFTIDDPTALETQAQTKALNDAKSKAKMIAGTLGITLGKLTYAQVNSTGLPQSTIAFSKNAMDAAPAPTTPISPGEITIQASATTNWNID